MFTFEMFVCASFQYSTLLFTGRFGSFFYTRKIKTPLLSVTGLLSCLKYKNHWKHFWIILAVSTNSMIGKT